MRLHDIGRIKGPCKSELLRGLPIVSIHVSDETCMRALESHAVWILTITSTTPNSSWALGVVCAPASLSRFIAA